MNLRPDHAGISVVDVPGDAGRVALVRNGDFILELFCIPGAVPLPEERRHPATDLRMHGIKHVAYSGNLVEFVER